MKILKSKTWQFAGAGQDGYVILFGKTKWQEYLLILKLVIY